MVAGRSSSTRPHAPPLVFGAWPKRPPRPPTAILAPSLRPVPFSRCPPAACSGRCCSCSQARYQQQRPQSPTRRRSTNPMPRRSVRSPDLASARLLQPASPEVEAVPPAARRRGLTRHACYYPRHDRPFRCGRTRSTLVSRPSRTCQGRAGLDACRTSSDPLTAPPAYVDSDLQSRPFSQLSPLPRA